MSNGWKQIWQDLWNALRGNTGRDAAAEEDAAGLPPASSQPTDGPGEGAPPVDVVQMAATPPEPTTLLSNDTVDGSVPLPVPLQTASVVDPLQDTQQAGETIAPPVPRWRALLGQSFTIVVIVLLLVRLAWVFGAERVWAEWTEPASPSPDVVATFDEGRITIADLEAHLQLLVPEQYQATIRSSEGMRLLVDEMVVDELVKRWAAERRFDADETFQHTMAHITEDVNLESFNNQLRDRMIVVPESEIQAYYEANRTEFGDQTLSIAREQIRRLLVSQREQQFMADYIVGLKLNASITRNFELLDISEPTEAELQAYYQANIQSYTAPAQFTVDLLEFPIGTDETAARSSADAALRALQTGADFSLIPAQMQEAQLNTGTILIEGIWGAEWDAAMQALQPDEFTGVLRTNTSWAIARLIEALPARMLTFDESRSQVLVAVHQQQLDTWMQSNAPKTLFMLQSKQYSLGQFYTEYQELPPAIQEQYAGPAGMKRLADQLIERLLLVEDTYDQLLQVQNKEILDQTRLNLLLQMLDQEEIDDKIAITDAEIRQFYDENPELMTLPPRARIRYIRVGAGTTDDERQDAQARIDEAYRKLVPNPLQQAVDFATVAQEYSEDPETAANGGELPDWIGETNNPFEPITLHDLHQIILGLEINQISPPFPLGDSYYIVQVIERTQDGPLAFEEMQPMIRDELHRQKHDALGKELKDRLTKAANVTIYNRVINAYAAQFAQQEQVDSANGSAP